MTGRNPNNEKIKSENMKKCFSQAGVPTVCHSVEITFVIFNIHPMIFANFSLIKGSLTLMTVPMLFLPSFLPCDLKVKTIFQAEKYLEL